MLHTLLISRYKLRLLYVFLLISTLFLSQSAMAGTGWYVTIHNDSDTDLHIRFAGNDHWWCNDFCGPSVISAHQSKFYYTEVKARLGHSQAIQGINMNDTHVEFYVDGHSHSGVEIVNKPLFKSLCVVDQGCYCRSGESTAISTTNTSAVSASIDAGSSIACSGSFGTVRATVHYRP